MNRKHTLLSYCSGWRVAVVSVLVALLAYAVPANAQVRISQVYTQGGLSGAGAFDFDESPYHADFIELYNAGSTPVNLTAWSVQFLGPTATTVWTKFDLTAAAAPIAPNSYFLIRLTDPLSGGGGSYPFDLNRTGTASPLISTGGKVALVTNQTQLPAIACPDFVSNGIIDLVGISGSSTANCSETAPTSMNNARLSTFRKCGGRTDTDNNLADFEARPVYPHYSGSPAFPGIEVAVTLSTANIGPCFPTTAGFQSVARGTSTLLITASRTTCSHACGTCPGDLEPDSSLDGRDVNKFVECVILANTGPATPGCACANVAPGCNVNAADVSQFVNMLLSPACTPIGASTGGIVTADLTQLGGPAAQVMYDDGTNGDVTAADNIYSYNFAVPGNSPLGVNRAIIVTVTDDQCRTQTGVARILVENGVPPNDFCTGAIDLTNESLPYVETDINNRLCVSPDGQPSCLSGTTLVRQGVWYKYIPAQSGIAIVSETGSQSVVIAAYTGPDCNSLTSLTAGQNGCYTSAATNFRSIPMTAGNTYWILIGPSSTTTTSCPTATLTIEFDFATAPVNDLCTGAIDLSNVTLPYNATVQVAAATDDGGVSCAPAANTNTGRFGVWYKFTPTQGGVVNLNESGSLAALHAVWSGPDCSSLTPEFCSATDTNQGFGVAAGETYWILLASDVTGAVSTFPPMVYTLNFTPIAPPANDDICNALDVSAGGNFVVDNRNASADAVAHCLNSGATQTKLGVWFKYTAASNCVLKIAENSTQDIAITAYAGPTCTSISFVKCTLNESTTLEVVNGQTYWFLVGHPAANVTFPTQDLSVTFTCGQPPANDAPCDAAALVLGSPVSIDNSFALPDNDVSCNTNNAPNVWHGVWYSYTPATDCSMYINETSSQNVVIGYFTNGCFGLSPFACVETDNTSEYVDLNGGVEYLILIGINSLSAPTVPTVNLAFTATCVTPDPGDACRTAVTIPTTPFSDTVNNSTFLANSPGAGACDQTFSTVTPWATVRNDVWYKYVATSNCTGLVKVSPSTNYDVLVQAWEGADCQNKTLVGCIDAHFSTDGPGVPEYLSFAMTMGQTYWIRYGKTSSTSAGGSTLLEFDCQPGPTNDLPCNATVLTSLPANDFVDISAATHDVWMEDGIFTNPTTNFCGTVTPTATFYGVWYTYTPATDCTIVIEETGPLDANFGVFNGDCNGLLLVACTGGVSYEVISVQLYGGTQYWFLVGYNHITRQPDPSFSGLSLSFDCRPAPANDLPCGAVNLNSSGLPYFDQVDIATATSDPRMTGNCVAPAAPDSENGVWYSYVPSSDCTLTVNASSVHDASIGVYTASDCSGPSELTCTNNNVLSFGLTSGQQYLILVSLSGISPGIATQAQLAITLDCSNPPSNDTACGASEILSTPYSATQSITLAADDVDSQCNTATGNQVTQKGVWWKYTATSDCMGVINETSSLDVAIAVFQDFGSGCANISEVGCSSADHFGFPMINGQTYWILIGLQTTTPTVPTAPVVMTFNCIPNTPPANDQVCGATVINSLPFFDNPVIATATHDQDVSCNQASASTVDSGVWYQYTPSSNCTLLLGEGTINNVVWGIYTAADCNDSLIDVGCTTTEAGTSINLNSGTTYWILVGLDWQSTGVPPTTPGLPLSLTIDCVNMPANDICAAAQSIASLPFSVTYDPFIATDGLPVGSCNSASATTMDNDVWFTWTAPANCFVNVDLQDISDAFQYGQICVVYAGPDCNNLVEVSCAYSSGGVNQIPFGFVADANETYWFQTGRRFLSTGSNLGPTTLTVTGPCP